MLSFDKMLDLEQIKLNTQFNEALISALVHMQALVEVLKEKNIVSEEEIEQQYKKTLEEHESWKDFLTEMEERLKSIDSYENEPDTMFRNFFKELLK